MRSRMLRILLVSVCLAMCGRLAADVAVIKDKDGNPVLSLGGDTSLRLEHYSREAYIRNMNPTRANQGPATEFYRQQTRLWADWHLTQNVELFTRVAHRWQDFSSRSGDNRANKASWEWPDEVVIDNLYLNFDKIADTGWSLRFGRMDLTEKNDKGVIGPMFGNGMVLFEGTPGDGSRTLYFDGLVATYKAEQDVLRLFAFYNQYKDEFIVINNRDRRLSVGDSSIVGAYWTHKFDKIFNTDLYLMGVDVHDEQYDNQNMQMATPGVRVFGSPHDLVDYSLEYAQQIGKYQAGVRAGDKVNAYGSMVDARVNLKTPTGTVLQPEFQFEYTWFSGDDPGDGDSYGGWVSSFAGYPIWTEELMPNMLGGNWTNLHQFRLAVPLQVVPKKVTVTPSYAYLLADHTSYAMAGGGGANGDGAVIGHLIGIVARYQITSWWSTSFIVSTLIPGDYFDAGDAGTQEWIRLETRLSF